MYSLTTVADWADAGAGAALPTSSSGSSSGSRGPGSASQRQQRRAQQSLQVQGAGVPLLPPVATLRLPGKVSCLAFSPDMQGVISVGDYDGTLTQVNSHRGG